ncbi:MAG: tryptophan-rich sensory protein [Chlamydiae bacterium]|jgi:tryptophan-rich sensory protein|nr:tryptophan-rich sensory protein [Chlamydiota bacterium]
MRDKKTVSFFLFIILVFSIATIGNRFTASSLTDWYAVLKKPSWNPPSYVFGPVWTILYLMIAVSGWRIYLSLKKGKEKAFMFYSIQLLANFLWPFFFFYLQSPLLALVDIIVLLIFLACNIKAFYELDKLSGLLLFPYFVWTFFATMLNAAIWCLN